MPFWSHKSKFVASTWKLELVPNPMLALRVPQIRYQAQIEQAFQYVGFLKKFYVLCSEYRELTLVVSISIVEPWEGPEK